MNSVLPALVIVLCLAGCASGGGASGAADPRFGPTCRAADMIVKDGYMLVPTLDTHAKTALDAVSKGPVLMVQQGGKQYAYHSRDWLKHIEVDLRTLGVRDRAIATSAQLQSANPASVDLARFRPDMLAFVNGLDTAADAYATLSAQLADRAVSRADYTAAENINGTVRDQWQAFMKPELQTCGVNFAP